MRGLSWLDDALGRLEGDGLLRVRRPAFETTGPYVGTRDGRVLLNLCGNDYLGLGGQRPEGSAGAGASRVVVGDLAVHERLEGALAAWLGVDGALLFNSGYAANVGAIAALSGEGSLVVSDALNHASVVDGCRLGRGRVVVTRHRDVADVEAALASAPEQRRLVVTEGYFSMDGTIAPLAELRAVCDRHGAALYVDEAHALGVFGPAGRGVGAAAGVTPEVLVGTLGKAFGASGAFVAGRSSLMRWLWNRARSFVFSTGLSPLMAQAALDALPTVVAGERTATLLQRATELRGALAAEGLSPAPGSEGPIIPLLIGAPSDALAYSAELWRRDIFVHAIRPPTVPAGTSRLRLTVQSEHAPAALLGAARTISSVLR